MAQLIEIVPGIWQAERKQSFGWCNSMYVLRLKDGGLLIHSATRMGKEILDEIAALGEVRFLFAPNHFHHLGLPSYRERFPNAKVICSDGAYPRLTAKGNSGLIKLSELAPAEFAPLSLLELAGNKNGETLCVVGNTWITCDALFHENRPLTGAKGWLIRRLKTAPGLSIGTTFLALGVRNKKAMSATLRETFAKAPPARILFSHGQPYQVGDGSEFNQLVTKRLGH